MCVNTQLLYKYRIYSNKHYSYNCLNIVKLLKYYEIKSHFLNIVYWPPTICYNLPYGFVL